MKLENKKLFTILMIIVAYFFLSLFIFIPNCGSIYARVINPLTWIGLSVFGLFYIGNKTFKKRYHYDVNQTIILLLIIYVIIYYMSGLFLSYAKVPYSYTLLGIIKNLWTYGVVIICEEYLRQLLVHNYNKNKINLVLITLIFFLIDIVVVLSSFEFTSIEVIFKFVSYSVIPIIARNCLMTYLVYIGDIKSTLIYRIVTELLIFIIPIIPNINWFMEAIIKIILIYIVFIVINNLYSNKKEKISRHNKKRRNSIWMISCGIVITLSAMLISGIARFQMISVASNSMVPVFKRGDSILIDKSFNPDNIEVNDIIIFKIDNKTVIHRVIKITKQNNKIYFQTKGDNNSDPDPGLTIEDNVIGIYKFMIPSIGYPSIWFQELIKGR